MNFERVNIFCVAVFTVRHQANVEVLGVRAYFRSRLAAKKPNVSARTKLTYPGSQSLMLINRANEDEIPIRSFDSEMKQEIPIELFFHPTRIPDAGMGDDRDVGGLANWRRECSEVHAVGKLNGPWVELAFFLHQCLGIDKDLSHRLDQTPFGLQDRLFHRGKCIFIIHVIAGQIRGEKFHCIREFRPPKIQNDFLAAFPSQPIAGFFQSKAIRPFG